MYDFDSSWRHQSFYPVSQAIKFVGTLYRSLINTPVNLCKPLFCSSEIPKWLDVYNVYFYVCMLIECDNFIGYILQRLFNLIQFDEFKCIRCLMQMHLCRSIHNQILFVCVFVCRFLFIFSWFLSLVYMRMRMLYVGINMYILCASNKIVPAEILVHH